MNCAFPSGCKSREQILIHSSGIVLRTISVKGLCIFFISFISHQENSWTLKIFLIQASCWLEWGLISTDTVYNPQLVNACKKETEDKLVFHTSLFRLHNVMLLFLATLSSKTCYHILLMNSWGLMGIILKITQETCWQSQVSWSLKF